MHLRRRQLSEAQTHVIQLIILRKGGGGVPEESGHAIRFAAGFVVAFDQFTQTDTQKHYRINQHIGKSKRIVMTGY